jgi:hypothetical protein
MRGGQALGGRKPLPANMIGCHGKPASKTPAKSGKSSLLLSLSCSRDMISPFFRYHFRYQWCAIQACYIQRLIELQRYAMLIPQTFAPVIFTNPES